MSEPTLAKKRSTGSTSKVRNPGRKVERRIVHERCHVIVATLENAEFDISIEGVATDIGPRGIGLITNNPIAPRTTVTITLNSKYFTHEFSATVVWCRELPSSGKIIKVNPIFGWRMGLMFQPQGEDERKLLQHIFEQL